MKKYNILRIATALSLKMIKSDWCVIYDVTLSDTITGNTTDKSFLLAVMKVNITFINIASCYT